MYGAPRLLSPYSSNSLLGSNNMKELQIYGDVELLAVQKVMW